jgi:hypothetical protein
MSRFTLVVVSLALALSACATSYQPVDDGGGYSQRQLDPDVFLVSFHGNRYTGYDRARDLALLRAAEIGERLGYAYFSVEGRDDASVRTVDYGSSVTSTTGSVEKTSKGTEYSQTTTSLSGDYPSTEPGVNLWVRYYKAKPTQPILELHAVGPTALALRSEYDVETAAN